MFKNTHSYNRGVGNDLKFCRLPLKLFLKDEVLKSLKSWEKLKDLRFCTGILQVAEPSECIIL